MMTILATAIPNDKYRWFRNFKKSEISVVEINDEVKFIEKFNGKEKELSKQTILSLFPKDVTIDEMPLVLEENLDLYYFATGEHKIKHVQTFTRNKKPVKFTRKK